MILKNQNTSKTTYSLLDLLGADEVALSKAFAFLLSNDKDCYFKFLKYVGITTKNTENNYFKCSIITEKKREEGRTDIELRESGNYHIIVECKINKGKAIKQRTQYLTAFDTDASKRVLCFLTQERDTSKLVPKNVTVKNINWLDIIELYNNKHFTHKPIVSDFLKYTTKNYKMRELKEILIQDVGEQREIERFEKFGVYRRAQTFGAPIYFAPYFNRNCGRPEGISNLSKILGILTFKVKEIDNFHSDLESFSADKTQVNNWIKGVKHGKDKKNEVYTYYFLDSPRKFANPLKKDGGIKEGRGKDWIAAMIPSNRCVTFRQFLDHIPELMTNNTNR